MRTTNPNHVESQLGKKSSRKWDMELLNGQNSNKKGKVHLLSKVENGVQLNGLVTNMKGKTHYLSEAESHGYTRWALGWIVILYTHVVGHLH